MSKAKNYQLRYQVDAESLEDVVSIAFDILNETRIDPTSIILPDGRELQWNGFLADKFAAEGHITEKEFIELSLK